MELRHLNLSMTNNKMNKILPGLVGRRFLFLNLVERSFNVILHLQIHQRLLTSVSGV
jgi:hypothetical protein